MPTCGRILTAWPCSMNYTGAGSRAMPATRAMSVQMPWPIWVSRNCPEGRAALLRADRRDTYPMRQIVLDTETTGLEPEQGHRVVELACVEIVNRRVTDRHLHLYLNPDRDS